MLHARLTSQWRDYNLCEYNDIQWANKARLTLDAYLGWLDNNKCNPRCQELNDMS